ncbi:MULTISPECIES: hypothetical protein [unclassified Carboxylicivirga]|uniref:hypothetical protein n=1 Tax=Carboxylicivirga TaxID=1628153 RepID=UPI003D343426
MAVELIFKSRALYEERENIEAGKINNYNELKKKWGKNGHVIQNILDYYQIDISEHEQLMIEELQPFMIWAGRFPFPLNDDLAKHYEVGNKSLSLRPDLHIKVQQIIETQIQVMSK